MRIARSDVNSNSDGGEREPEDGDEQDPWGSCLCYDRLAYFLTMFCRCSSYRSGPCDEDHEL
jgi:hypothetical protein